MMIVDPIQTERALLTWQRPLSMAGRRDRFAVGELRQTDDGVEFSYFSDDALISAREAGYRSYPGLLPTAHRTGAEGLSVLMRRLPPTDRSDFPDFMRAFGLDPDAGFSDLSLLAYTGARLKSDNDSFGITETFDGFTRPFDYVFDVAGVRHYREAMDTTPEGSDVFFRHEADSQHDAQAVEIVNEGGLRLGYLNKLQAAKMLQWMEQGQVSAHIYRKNGRPDYPRLFIEARISPAI